MARTLQFKNKVVLVTGGNSGIGKATALMFGSLGAQVIITGRRKHENSEVVNYIQSHGGEAVSFNADISKPEEIKLLFEQIKSSFGRLDIAVNCAGIEGKSFTDMLHYPDDIWEEVIRTNLSGTWYCMKNEVKMMLGAKQGAIVNVSSLAGLTASLTGGVAYTASKHGVVGLTKAAAKEYAKQNIRINVVCPALIKTPLVEDLIKNLGENKFDNVHPIGRLGLPEEVAEAICWLCSDSSSFLTGVALPLDGGVMA